MSHLILIHPLLLYLLTGFFALTQQTAAAVPASLNQISNPLPPSPYQLNSTISNGANGPPVKKVAIDSTHSVYFTQYQHLTPERNYFAAIISMQTSLMAEYFAHRAELLGPGPVRLDAFGVQIYVENPTGLLTYAMAHRMLGELGEFLMQGNFCSTRFELWEVQPTSVRQLSVGWIVPGHMAKTVA